MRAEDRIYKPGDLPPPVREGVPRLAVLGYPIGHSRSPQMHRAALDWLAASKPVYKEWDYIRIEVSPDELGEFLSEAIEAGFVGINLTVPHKEVVLPFLSRMDPVVQRVGAANTLILGRESGIEGINTDGVGLLAAMREAFGFSPAGKRILVLGAGGAARSAVDAMLGAGAARVFIANRTLSRAEQLALDLAPWYEAGAIEVGRMEQVPRIAAGVDAIVQASSAGLNPASPPPFRTTEVEGRPILYEMIYGARPTPLLRDALGSGWPAADGLGMLVHQGRRSLEIWTGESVDPGPMRISTVS